MPSIMMQLVAYGAHDLDGPQDLFIIGNPQITRFRVTYGKSDMDYKLHVSNEVVICPITKEIPVPLF